MGTLPHSASQLFQNANQRNRPNKLIKEGLGSKAPRRAAGSQRLSPVHVSLLLQINLGANFLLSQQDLLPICISQGMSFRLPISEHHLLGLVKKPGTKYLQNILVTLVASKLRNEWPEGLFLNIPWILICMNVYLIFEIILIFLGCKFHLEGGDQSSVKALVFKLARDG